MARPAAPRILPPDTRGLFTSGWLRNSGFPRHTLAGRSNLTGMADTVTRPRLRQVFPGAGHLNLAPMPGGPPQVATGGQYTDARLALALLLARHGSSSGGKYAYRYEAVDQHGVLLADEDDHHVQALTDRLRGTYCGLEAQRAALEAVGLA